MTDFNKMSKRAKERICEEFLKFHQASTEPCKFGYKIDNDIFRSVIFFPLNNVTFHSPESIVKFAEYYKASVYFDYDETNKRVCARVF